MKKSILSLLLALTLTLTVFAAVPMGASAATSGKFTYTLDENGRATITNYSGNDSVLTVPAELDGHPVYAIGESALSKKSFTQVILSEGIQVLENYSFEYNYFLTDIKLPDSLTKIGTMSFNGCTELKTLNIPKSVATVGTYIVWFSAVEQIHVAADNPNLKSVDGVLYSKDGKTLYTYPPEKKGDYTVQGGTENISIGAFMNCAVTALTFPTSISSIGYQAFSGCSELTSVTFATGPASIGTYAFSKCEKLTELIIPEGTTEIKSYIVADCTALRSLTLPASVTTISEKAFRSASSKLTVYTPAPGVVADTAAAAGVNLVLTEAAKAQAVVAQIEALGAITSLEQEAEIRAARAAFDALEAWQQALVENIDRLEAAEAAIEAVKVQAVMDQIDAIGPITSLAQEAQVISARAAFDALEAQQQALVENIDVLEAAEAAIEARKKPAYSVVQMIAELGAITLLEQEPQVEAARTAYDELEEDVQKLVVNYPLLVSAEALIESLKIDDTTPGFLLGDIDGSGSLDVGDIIKIKMMILSEEDDPEQLKIADINGSGQLDVADIVTLKKIIMVS